MNYILYILLSIKYVHFVYIRYKYKLSRVSTICHRPEQNIILVLEFLNPNSRRSGSFTMHPVLLLEKKYHICIQVVYVVQVG